MATEVYVLTVDGSTHYVAGQKVSIAGQLRVFATYDAANQAAQNYDGEAYPAWGISRVEVES